MNFDHEKDRVAHMLRCEEDKIFLYIKRTYFLYPDGSWKKCMRGIEIIGVIKKSKDRYRARFQLEISGKKPELDVEKFGHIYIFRDSITGNGIDIEDFLMEQIQDLYIEIEEERGNI